MDGLNFVNHDGGIPRCRSRCYCVWASSESVHEVSLLCLPFKILEEVGVKGIVR